MRGKELLAELVVTGGDFPWLNARMRPAPGFEAIRPLFEQELRALERIDACARAAARGASMRTLKRTAPYVSTGHYDE